MRDIVKTVSIHAEIPQGFRVIQRIPSANLKIIANKEVNLENFRDFGN